MNTRARSKRQLGWVAPLSSCRRARQVVPTQKRIADLATKNGLPAIYARGDYVASGGLINVLRRRP